MCGIVGLISKDTRGFFQADLKIFKEMLWADQLRGTDGTGLFYVDSTGKVEIEKDAVAAQAFLWTNMDKVEPKIIQKGRIIIGHNRAATKGNKIKVNTHPFNEDKVTLVHNGTLYTHKHLADVEVDSHAICHSMAKQGYARTLKELWGAFALVWFNEQNNRLYLSRNKERPLNIVETKDLFVISSEPGLASWILERNNEKVMKITELQPGKIYSFNLDDLSSFKEKEVKLREERPFVQALPVIPHTTKSTTETTGTTKLPTFGDTIEFFPLREYNENGKPALSGLYEGIGFEVDIEYVGELNERDLISKLADEMTLTGVIYQKKQFPKIDREVWVVRNVKKKSSINTVKTLNNVSMSSKEIENIQGTACDMCGGWVNTQYLDKMVVEKNNGMIYTVYCHECGPIAERHGL